MNITHRIITATAALAAALVAHPSIAGLRQWEPSDYIQDNLVLHYDGIRNAGLAAAHDGAATAWVDLSPSGNDATLVNGPGASGYWGATGFVFPGSSNLWIAAEQTSLSGDFTMQVACDTTASVMQGTCSWPNLIGGYGKGAAGAADELTIFYHKSNKRLSTKFLNTYLDQYLPSWNYKYATLIRSGSMGSLFDGTTPTLVSTSKTGAIGSRVMVGAGMDNNLAGAEGRLFTGTIYSVRIYNDALTGDELAWNRALDEARFHSAAVPESAVSAAFVPDAVIASSIAGAEGMEAAGCHMVDDGGHVFRAAPSATVSGTAYACTGCTIATWDASLGAYGAAETRDGVFAVAVAPGDKVKITWQWAAASSSLDAGYVTDGLSASTASTTPALASTMMPPRFGRTSPATTATPSFTATQTAQAIGQRTASTSTSMPCSRQPRRLHSGHSTLLKSFLTQSAPTGGTTRLRRTSWFHRPALMAGQSTTRRQMQFSVIAATRQQGVRGTRCRDFTNWQLSNTLRLSAMDPRPLSSRGQPIQTRNTTFQTGLLQTL